MSDVLTVVGRSDGIKEKNQGWYEVEVVMPGKKYPLRLSTKSSTILDQVRALEGGIGTFSYKEVESDKINPNSNKPYINRYLEGAVAGAIEGAGTGPAGGSSEKMTKEEWNAKDRRDFRSRAWAQTISAFAHTFTAETEPLQAFAKMKPFQRKLYEDIVGDLEPKPQEQKQQEQPQPAEPPVEPSPEESSYDEPPPYTDDDIPF